LKDRHTSWLESSFLSLIDYGREAILEINKEMLAFKYEPFYIGLRLRRKTV